MHEIKKCSLFDIWFFEFWPIITCKSIVKIFHNNDMIKVQTWYLEKKKYNVTRIFIPRLCFHVLICPSSLKKKPFISIHVEGSTFNKHKLLITFLKVMDFVPFILWLALIHQNLLIMPSQLWLPCDHSRLGLEIQSDQNGALLYFLVYGSNALVMLELIPLVAMPTLQRVRTGVWQLFDFVLALSSRFLKTFKIKEQPIWVLRKFKIE